MSKITINVKLDRPLWLKAKSRAALADKTVQQWLSELLEKEVGGKNG